MNEKSDLQEHLKVLQEENYNLIQNLEKMEDDQRIDELHEMVRKLEKAENEHMKEIQRLVKENEKSIERAKELQEDLNRAKEENKKPVIVESEGWKEEKSRLEEKLQDLGIPVFHDDQHGTAIVVLAGLINACKFTGRKLANISIVLVGAP